MVRRKISRRRRPIRRKRMRFNKGNRKFNKKASRSRQTLLARPGLGMVRQPFAPNLFTVFSYTESLQLVQGTPSVPGFVSYRANGPFDPRVAVGGRQPRYWDTLMGTTGGTGPYDHYRVHAAKITVTFWPESTAAGSANGIVAIIPERNNVALPATFDELSERPYVKKAPMTTLNSYKPRKIKHYVKMATILGHKDLSDVDETAALYNALPNEEIWFTIYSCAIDPGDALSPRIEVNIQYYTQLYNLVDVADS